GVREIDDPPPYQLELAHEGARHEAGLIDLLELHIGSNLLPELLEYLTGITPAWRRGHDHLEFDRLAVLLDQSLGLFDIIGQRAVVLALHPGAIAVGVGGWPGQAIRKGL